MLGGDVNDTETEGAVATYFSHLYVPCPRRGTKSQYSQRDATVGATSLEAILRQTHFESVVRFGWFRYGAEQGEATEWALKYVGRCCACAGGRFAPNSAEERARESDTALHCAATELALLCVGALVPHATPLSSARWSQRNRSIRSLGASGRGAVV